MENGYLDDVDAVYGVHIWSDLEAGKFSLEAGERMASCDSFKITVEGFPPTDQLHTLERML